MKHKQYQVSNFRLAEEREIEKDLNDKAAKGFDPIRYLTGQTQDSDRTVHGANSICSVSQTAIPLLTIVYCKDPKKTA